MRGVRHLAAAVTLVWATGCGTSDEGSAVVVPTAPQSGLDDSGADSMPEGVSLILASKEGVDLVEGNGDAVRLSHRPAAVAYGIGDNVVVYQGSDGVGDVYPPWADGPVELWEDGTVRVLPTAQGASSVRLLDAGVVNDRPVALVAERFSEGQPERAAEVLVLIDLEDLTRVTAAARQPAWESGHLAAHLRSDGDVTGLFHQGPQVHLIRWSPQEQSRVWSVEVAEDVGVSLVASDVSVAVVQRSFDKRRGFAPTLTVTRHDPATGEPLDRTVVDVADPEGVLDTGLFCRDWLTASELVCARSGGAPVAIAGDGSFYELGGPPGAMPSVVEEP